MAADWREVRQEDTVVDLRVDPSGVVIDVTDAAIAEYARTVPQQRIAEAWSPATGGDALTARPGARDIPQSATSRAYAVVSRLFDVTVSLLGLAVSAPLMLLIAVVIRCDSKGPVLFRQDRIRRGGGTFRFVKFRTMYADARQRFPELYAYRFTPDEIDRMQFKLPEDPRLTRVGRWLRRTSLDELPNFLNVLKGDMSLVGPRPEIPEMLPYYRPRQLAKFSVKPGLTGLAQTTGRNILTFQQTIAADLAYVRQRSLVFDLKIIFRTVWTVVTRLGAL